MDILQSQNSNNNCKRHPSKEVLFISIDVNEVKQDKQGKESLYYCEICLSEDTLFQSTNMLSISQIIEDGEKNIISKWPPVNNYEIIKQLIQKTKENKNEKSMESKIANYFSDLKNEIMTQLDYYQKKIINSASHFIYDHDHIYDDYKKISRIDELRSILLQNQSKNNFTDKSEELNILITHIQSEKDKNTQLLETLLNRCKDTDNKFNMSHLNAYKDYLITQIKKLDLFSIGQAENFNQRREDDKFENKYSQLLMKLISNKSNFCSNDFLQQIERYLQLLDPIISKLQVEKTNDKQPIRFEDLEEDKIDLINKQVEHMIKLQNNEQYNNEIRTSKQIEFMQKQFLINNNQDGNRQEELNSYFLRYLIETHPFFCNLFEQNKIEIQPQNGLKFEFSEEQKADTILIKSNTVAYQSASSKQRFCLMNPKLDQKKIQRFAFKIECLARWIGLGICFKNKIINQKYEFHSDTIGKGYYLISSFGISWSHSSIAQQGKIQSFTFSTGDVIYVEFNPQIKKIKFQKKNTKEKYYLDIELDQNDDVVPCVNLSAVQDEISIINELNEINSVEFI